MLRNHLMEHLPPTVSAVLERLGANLKTARVRRGMTVQEVADHVGVSRQLVAAAEKGKPMTGVAVYAAILQALNLLDDLADVANPAKDKVGLAGALMQGRKRGRREDDA